MRFVLRVYDNAGREIDIPAIAGKDGKDGYTPVKGVDYFDGKDGKDGQDGQDGKDGFSPVITVEELDDGVSIVFTGANGSEGIIVKNGKTPVKGEDYFTEAEKLAMCNDVFAIMPYLDMVVTYDNGHQETYEIYGKQVL